MEVCIFRGDQVLNKKSMRNGGVQISETVLVSAGMACIFFLVTGISAVFWI